MSEENRSERCSWEEQVEVLTQLPLEDQLRELLRMLREQREENQRLQDISNTKDAQIKELEDQIELGTKGQCSVGEEIEREVDRQTKTIRRQVRHELESEYGTKSRQMTVMLTAALSGCIILLIALLTKSHAYMENVKELGASMGSLLRKIFYYVRSLVVSLDDILSIHVTDRIIRSCITGLAAFIVISGVIAVVTYVIYRVVRKNGRISRSRLPGLLIGAIIAIAVPALLCGLLGNLGVNACLVSVIGVIIVTVFMKNRA